MKLTNISYWKAIHFEDRTILREDEKYFPKGTWIGFIYSLEVEPMDRKGHYKVIQK